jgi:hypothetical protein
MKILMIIAFGPFSLSCRLYLNSFLNVATIFLNDTSNVDSFFHILPVISKRAEIIIIHELENIDEAGSKVENKFVIIFILSLLFLPLGFF